MPKYGHDPHATSSTMANHPEKALSTAVIATLLTLGAAPSWAQSVATIAGVEGAVTVNQGENIVSASPGMALEPGHQIMVLEGGSATIRYSNGCVIEVGELAQLPILAEGDCNALAAAVVPLAGGALAAAGAAGAGTFSALSLAVTIGPPIVGVIISESSTSDRQTPISGQ